MDIQAAKQSLKFIKDVKALNKDNEPVFLNPKAKPHEMTLLQFVSAWYPKTIELIEKENIHVDPFELLMKEHAERLLEAIEKGTKIPIPVLKEYRFKQAFFKPIRKYCRNHKINLDV